MRNILSRLILIVLLILGGTATILAEPPPPPPFGGAEPFGIFGPGPKEERFLDRISQDLGLSAEQQEKIKAAREKRKAGGRALSEKLTPLHEDLRKLLEATKVDMGAVRSKLKQIGEIQLELRILHIEDRLEFESFLTPEQKQKLSKMHKERIQRMHDRREPPDHPPRDRDRDCKCP